jgi:tetratricopeptide (TPR) repeat protein
MTPTTEAETHYLLGAELAQSGHYDRAIVEMQAAVRMQPDLHTATLQLGLLLLTLNRPAEAVAAWQPLGYLNEREPLRLFKEGLEALIYEDFDGSVRLLTEGIAANHSNPALNRDMGLVITRAREAEQRAVRTDFSLYNQ